MKILTKITRQLYRDRFHWWVGQHRQLPLPRLYLGNKSRHYNLFLMLRAYDETTTTVDFTKTITDEIQRGLVEGGYDQPILRETVYGIYREENEFTMVNYLDRVGVRTHLILRGAGEYALDNGEVCSYTKGDVLLFEPADLGKPTLHVAEHDSLHFVNCWSKKSHPRNWQLFADSLAGHTAWPGLGGDIYFKPKAP